MRSRKLTEVSSELRNHVPENVPSGPLDVSAGEPTAWINATTSLDGYWIAPPAVGRPRDGRRRRRRCSRLAAVGHRASSHFARGRVLRRLAGGDADAGLRAWGERGPLDRG